MDGWMDALVVWVGVVVCSLSFILLFLYIFPGVDAWLGMHRCFV